MKRSAPLFLLTLCSACAMQVRTQTWSSFDTPSEEAPAPEETTAAKPEPEMKKFELPRPEGDEILYVDLAGVEEDVTFTIRPAKEGRVLNYTIFGAKTEHTNHRSFEYAVASSTNDSYIDVKAMFQTPRVAVYTARPTTPVVVTTPPADAPIEVRALEAHVLAEGGPLPGTEMEKRRLALKWFSTLPASFFVYAARDSECVDRADSKSKITIAAGEPLLVQAIEYGAVVVRATGQQCTLAIDEDRIALARPARVVLPEPSEHPGFSDYDYWKKKRFLPIEDDDPRVVAMHAHVDQVRACTDKQWDKLDPDKTANRLDVVTYRGNRVQKVENLGSRLWRKIKKRCRVERMDRHRAKLRYEARAVWIEQQRAHLAALASRP